MKEYLVIQVWQIHAKNDDEAFEMFQRNDLDGLAYQFITKSKGKNESDNPYCFDGKHDNALPHGFGKNPMIGFSTRRNRND